MMLDQLIDYNIGFIKLDIEGHEYAALIGARGMLDRHKPIVLLECNDIGESIPDSFEFRFSLGYDGWFIYDKKFFHVSKLRPEMHDLSAFQFGRPRSETNYTNNFIFFPRMEIGNILKAAINGRLCNP